LRNRDDRLIPKIKYQMSSQIKKVLFILHPGFEELEAIAPIDILRRSGLKVLLATPSENLEIKGKNGIVVLAEKRLTDLDDILAYDAIVIPGGPGVQELRQTPEASELLKSFGHAGKPTAAICAAPLLLKDAGLLNNGEKVAAHFTCKAEIPNMDGNSPFVEDGNIYTSRGAGDAIAFGLGLAARFAGRQKAIEVAESICLTEKDVP
jgi:4-methyl-5(b-hydroxyethyl)-thiazole monophosphate biosynthesis